MRMPHSFLIPTVIPGLSVEASTRRLLHEASGATLLTMPALPRQALTGYVHTPIPSPLRTPWTLGTLAGLDWTGTLTPDHWATARRVEAGCATAEAAAGWLARQQRILLGLTVLTRMMSGERGQALSVAATQLSQARALRIAAGTPAERAAATRQLRRAEQALATARVTEPQLDRFMRGSRAQATFAGLHDQSRQSQIYAERERRLERGRAVAEAALRCPETPHHAALRVCLTLTVGEMDLAGAYQRRSRAPGEDGQRRVKLWYANQERCRRAALHLSVDPADPAVRVLTRPARLNAGHSVLSAGATTSNALRAYRKACEAFWQATQYRTSKTRLLRLTEATEALRGAFPCEVKRAAVVRGVRASVQVRTRQWGAQPYRPAEWPGGALF